MMRLSIPSWLPLPAHMQTHMTAAHAGQVLRAILLIQTELCCQLLVNLLSAEYCLVFFSHTWTFKNYQFLNYLYLAKVTCAVPYHLIEKHWWWDAGWGIHQVAVTFSKWLFLRNDTSYSLGDCLSVPISFFFCSRLRVCFCVFMFCIQCVFESSSLLSSCLDSKEPISYAQHLVTVFSRSYQNHYEFSLLLFAVTWVFWQG